MIKSKIVFLSVVSLGLFLGSLSTTVAREKSPDDITIQKSDKTLNPIKMPAAGDTSTCYPTSCEQAKAHCGTISDGCGHELECSVTESIALTVTPKDYTGICPATFKFVATITAERAGYAFLNWRNSPFVDKRVGLFFKEPGTQQIVYEWKVSNNLPVASQWLALDTDCNGKMAKESFSVHCTAIKFDGSAKIPQ